VPGIDASYLAMDTEEGVEVVWNEVQFSERKNFKSQEEKISQVFDNLILLEHPNIVKFHKYWMDGESEKPRIIFITEYMPSGSLKQFLKKTKRNVKKLPLQAWKRWCTQILSALSYLHSCSTPVIHGNLTCDTIFIQHNGLIKIGSVAPDAIHIHVKTCRGNVKNMHFVAPEYGVSVVTPAADVFSFGMCALEMGALEILGNGDSGCIVTEENVAKTIELLEHPLQKDFIRRCLQKNPRDRLSARELLFHPILFEVHSLKLLAGHSLVKNKRYLSENWTDDAIGSYYGSDKVIAEVRHSDDRPGVQMRMSDVPVLEKLEKFMEDVRNGIYPLTAFPLPSPPPAQLRVQTPETVESVKSSSPDPVDVETRKVVHMMCSVKPHQEQQGMWMTILLRMDDKMNRQLSCQVTEKDNSSTLTDELVYYGFINQSDRQQLASLVDEALQKCFHANGNSLPPHVMIGPSIANPISFGYPPPPMSVPIVTQPQGGTQYNIYMPPPFTEHGMT